MKNHDIVFSEELEKDLNNLQHELSLEQKRIDSIYSFTIDSEKKSIPLIQKIRVKIRLYALF